MKYLENILFALCLTAVAAVAAVSCSSNDSADSGSNGSGTGGSMARFTISGDYLYTVNDYQLRTVSLADPSKPEFLRNKTQNLDFGIETIFPLGDKLFIGARDGMYIYDISRPEYPQYLSKTVHITSCDPVVAYGNYAYVTLNSTLSRLCTRGTDELQVYDITDPKMPVEVYTDRSMTSPRGLGVDGAAARLFVCDNGLKVYDITDPHSPVWIDDLSDIPEADAIDTYDVIPLNGHLLLIGGDGLYQFDYTGDRLAFISKIDLRK